MRALIANLAWQLDHYSFISELSLIHFAKFQETALSDGLKIPQPIIFRLVVVKPGSNCCQLPLKALEKDKGDKQDAATSVGAAKGNRTDAAASAFFFKTGWLKIR